jgi:hypothetical protein
MTIRARRTSFRKCAHLLIARLAGQQQQTQQIERINPLVSSSALLESN